jgi:UDP-hydrolysing UDP-N-acetyl-D-glucosamine 2-epimerase
MKIALISGSRADAGALFAVKGALDRAGMATYWINVPPVAHEADQRTDIAYGAAKACRWVTEDLAALAPDLVILHGDRYEILGAATAAFLLGLPIAHLGGGDVTTGSQDDSIRHAITKLCHLHFTTCASSARRLVQLGEQPASISNVGDPGLDVFYNGSGFLTRDETLREIGLNGCPRYFVVAYHPNTLGDTEAEIKELRLSIEQTLLDFGVGMLLIGPNKDADYKIIDKNFRDLSYWSRVVYHQNLLRNVYLSALKHSIALVGNSSSGFYEAPSLGTPIINFRDRQKGRYSGNCLYQANNRDELYEAMKKLCNARPERTYINDYGTGRACDYIVAVLKNIDPKNLLRKQFYDMENGNGRFFANDRN